MRLKLGLKQFDADCHISTNLPATGREVTERARISPSEINAFLQ